MAGVKLPQTGGCLCGNVRYEIAEPPRLVYTCHCTDCQKLTSSAFSMALMVPRDALRLTGIAPLALRKTADSGHIVTRMVCPDCGCWLFSAPENGLARVRAGTLDDTSWLRPRVHFWTRSKQPWVALPKGDEVFETQPAGLFDPSPAR